MSSQPAIAYNIQAIHDCIVRDTDIFRKFNSKTEKLALYREKKKLLNKHPEVKKMIDAGFLTSLEPKRGKLVGKVGWLPPELIITDQRIREMCRNLFTYSKPVAEKTGIAFGPCPGVEKMSGCPMFSPGPEEMRAKLDEADIFIAMQSIYFVENPAMPGWHDFLIRKLKKEIEKIEGAGSVTAAFGAGPCQMCHPNPCLGGGKCRAPDEHLFSLESVGVPVSQLCRDMALVTGNSDWKVKFIKYFGTSRQSHKEWKLTSGLAVKLH